MRHAATQLQWRHLTTLPVQHVAVACCTPGCCLQLLLLIDSPAELHAATGQLPRCLCSGSPSRCTVSAQHTVKRRTYSASHFLSDQGIPQNPAANTALSFGGAKAWVVCCPCCYFSPPWLRLD